MKVTVRFLRHGGICRPMCSCFKSLDRSTAFRPGSAQTVKDAAELNELSDPQRDSIAGLLLTIALRRKIKRREFRVVHELLEVGCALGLTNGPVSSQAAEMLERLATFANITCSQRSEAVP